MSTGQEGKLYTWECVKKDEARTFNVGGEKPAAWLYSAFKVIIEIVSHLHALES